MKIALPLTATDEFPEHYGDARKFEVFDLDQAHHRVRRRLIVVPQASRPCQWPRFLRAADVDLILVGEIGPTARQQMAHKHIAVLAGVKAHKPEALVDAWLSGTLAPQAHRRDCPSPHPHLQAPSDGSYPTATH